MEKSNLINSSRYCMSAIAFVMIYGLASYLIANSYVDIDQDSTNLEVQQIAIANMLCLDGFIAALDALTIVIGSWQSTFSVFYQDQER